MGKVKFFSFSFLAFSFLHAVAISSACPPLSLFSFYLRPKAWRVVVVAAAVVEITFIYWLFWLSHPVGGGGSHPILNSY